MNGQTAEGLVWPSSGGLVVLDGLACGEKRGRGNWPLAQLRARSVVMGSAYWLAER